MDKIVLFFDHIPSSYRTGILVGGLLLFWLAEGIFPLFKFQYSKIRHAGLNLFFTLTTVIVNFIFAYFIVKSSDWVTAHQFGILYLFKMSLWQFAIAGVLLMDFIGAYFIHWLQHQVRFMWKFHLVHHTDTYVDTTTANRHHPGESMFRAIFTLIAVVASGSPMWLIMLYQSLSVFLSQFNHANIQLPSWLDRGISWIIVSPGMHKVHHHYVQPYTDTNYGNIFSIWDRIFGTFSSVSDSKNLIYGVDTHMEKEENSNMGYLLKIPFKPYRPRLNKMNDNVEI